MDHKIKLIGFDLDGTLLTSDKKLSERTRKTMELAISLGIVMVPATGRPLSGVPKELLEFPGIRYVVTANGARVLDIVEKRTMTEELLPREKCGQILSIFERYDTFREIYYNGTGYADREKLDHVERYQKDPAMQKYLRETRKPVDSVRQMFDGDNRGMDKIQALFARMEEKENAIAEIIETVEDVEVTGALSNNKEVNANGIHKGNALLRLGELLGIHREEIMAFGDGKNDRKMLETVGVGVAMANSVPEVLEAADMVTASNDDDGVAKVIEQYVLN
jgi:Cof subfamily protein (haloacid dehalogenase superfamily)